MSSSDRATVPIPTKSASEAQVVASLLRGAGIPVYVGGQMLQDEFGVAQRVMNLQSASVEVPRELEEKAFRILEEARGKSNER